jgi:hypothetical protein
LRPTDISSVTIVVFSGFFSSKLTRSSVTLSSQTRSMTYLRGYTLNGGSSTRSIFAASELSTIVERSSTVRTNQVVKAIRVLLLDGLV